MVRVLIIGDAGVCPHVQRKVRGLGITIVDAVDVTEAVQGIADPTVDAVILVGVMGSEKELDLVVQAMQEHRRALDVHVDTGDQELDQKLIAREIAGEALGDRSLVEHLRLMMTVRGRPLVC